MENLLFPVRNIQILRWAAWRQQRCWNFPSCSESLSYCPGFGQDRVNFQRTSGRGTAGQADPTWPNRAGYSIPCAIMLGSGGGELGGRENSLAVRELTVAVVEGVSPGCAVCSVFSPYLHRFCSCSLCLLFC